MDDDKLLGDVGKAKLNRDEDPAYQRIQANDRLRAQERMLAEAAERHRKLQRSFLLMFFILVLAAGVGAYYEQDRIKEWLGLVEKKQPVEKEPAEPEEIAHARNNIVIVQGVPISETYAAYQEGGSGFIAKWRGKNFVVTNIHVLAALDKPYFLTVSGHEIPVDLDRVFLAANEDVALIEVPDYESIFGESYPEAQDGEVPDNPSRKYTYEPFVISEDVDFTVKEGDRVSIYGNTLGKRIVQKQRGVVEGLGANIIKHTAPTKPGNSGSPIVYEPNGKVIGIDTYAIIYRDGKEQDENYGYRLDTISEWQPIGRWERFRETSKQFSEIKARTRDLIKLANGQLDPNMYEDTTFQNIWFTFYNRLRDIYGNRTVSSVESLSNNEKAFRSYQHFLQSVRSLLYQDVKDFTDEKSGSWTYNYFRIQALSEQDTRQQLESSINEAINDYDRIIRTMK